MARIPDPPSPPYKKVGENSCIIDSVFLIWDHLSKLNFYTITKVLHSEHFQTAEKLYLPSR